ncbi:chorismate mutase [Pelagibacteraceae bacterium]|nr:chorismate mutase [Pelagibacteraceae bacterium]
MKKTHTSLKKVRSEIDKLDDKILPLMVKRSQLVENALELKKLKSQIRDPKRIKVILDKIEKNSERYDVNKKLLRQIWKSMIECYIDYENKIFKKR